MSGATLSQDVIEAIVDLAKVDLFVRPETIAKLIYSAVLLDETRRRPTRPRDTPRQSWSYPLAIPKERMSANSSA
jgi:hypothetical protein